MYKVYWTEQQPISTVESTNHGLVFGTSEMDQALSLMSNLRQRKRDGENISYISMVSEHPDVVGEAGVDEVRNGWCPDGTEYTWKKRRI